MPLLSERARVIRSKNAGPYELTFDFMFDELDDMQEFFASLSPRAAAAVLDVEEDQILTIMAFPPAYAVKITMVRSRASGDLGETDVYGAQQHVPWLDYSY